MGMFVVCVCALQRCMTCVADLCVVWGTDMLTRRLASAHSNGNDATRLPDGSCCCGRDRRVRTVLTQSIASRGIIQPY
jgi:hypothetical protein